MSSSKVSVDCYDSIREIRILALNTTGKEWVALKEKVKALNLEERLVE